MKKISDAINCMNCKSVLKTPVVLPCSHSVCKFHLEDNSSDLENFFCMRCGAQHSIEAITRLPINEALVSVIEAQIQELNFGEFHDEAKNSCSALEKLISEVKALVNNSTNYFNSRIEELEIKVVNKKLELIGTIDKYTNKLLKILADYRERCKQNLEADKVKMNCSQVELLVKNAESKMANWLELLDQVKINEEKWKSITIESKQEIERLSTKVNSLKKKLLMKEFDDNNQGVDYFIAIKLTRLFAFYPK